MNARLSTLVSDQAIEVCDSKVDKHRSQTTKVPWKQSRSLLDSNEEEETRDDLSKQSVDMERIELTISEIDSFEDEPRVANDLIEFSKDNVYNTTSKKENDRSSNSTRTASNSDDSSTKPVTTSAAGETRGSSNTSFESFFSVAEGVIDVVCQATACDSTSNQIVNSCGDSLGGSNSAIQHSRHGKITHIRSSSESDLIPLFFTSAACGGSRQGGLLTGSNGAPQDPDVQKKSGYQNRIACRTRGTKHLGTMYKQWHTELTPYVSTPKRKAIRTDINDVSKSWDEFAVEGENSRLKHRSTTKKTETITSFFLQQQPETINECSSLSAELFYDSDPETILHRSKTAPARRKVAYEEDPQQVQQVPRSRLNLRDDKLVKECIQQLRRSSLDLLYHPPPLENGASSTPVSVVGWFEMGSRLLNKLIQPKFMWRPKFEPNANRRRLGGYSQSPHHVDLLGLVKILKPKAIDRTHYPFARTKRTFTLLSQTDDWFVFEARSEEECDKFVDGLKLLVARLASMVIVGDEAIIREFFSPWCHAEDLEVASKRIDQEGDSQQGDSIIGSTFVSTNEQQREALWGPATWN